MGGIVTMAGTPASTRTPRVSLASRQLWLLALVVVFSYHLTGWLLVGILATAIAVVWSWTTRVATSYGAEVTDPAARSGLVDFLAGLAMGTAGLMGLLLQIEMLLPDTAVAQTILVLTIVAAGSMYAFGMLRDGWRIHYLILGSAFGLAAVFVSIGYLQQSGALEGHRPDWNLQALRLAVIFSVVEFYAQVVKLPTKGDLPPPMSGWQGISSTAAFALLACLMNRIAAPDIAPAWVAVFCLFAVLAITELSGLDATVRGEMVLAWDWLQQRVEPATRIPHAIAPFLALAPATVLSPIASGPIWWLSLAIGGVGLVLLAARAALQHRHQNPKKDA